MTRSAGTSDDGKRDIQAFLMFVFTKGCVCREAVPCLLIFGICYRFWFRLNNKLVANITINLVGFCWLGLVVFLFVLVGWFCSSFLTVAVANVHSVLCLWHLLRILSTITSKTGNKPPKNSDLLKAPCTFHAEDLADLFLNYPELSTSN